MTSTLATDRDAAIVEAMLSSSSCETRMEHGYDSGFRLLQAPVGPTRGGVGGFAIQVQKS